MIPSKSKKSIIVAMIIKVGIFSHQTELNRLVHKSSEKSIVKPIMSGEEQQIIKDKKASQDSTELKEIEIYSSTEGPKSLIIEERTLQEAFAPCAFGFFSVVVWMVAVLIEFFPAVTCGEGAGRCRSSPAFSIVVTAWSLSIVIWIFEICIGCIRCCTKRPTSGEIVVTTFAGLMRSVNCVFGITALLLGPVYATPTFIIIATIVEFLLLFGIIWHAYQLGQNQCCPKRNYHKLKEIEISIQN